MYRMFWAAWAQRRPIRRILDHTRFEPFGRDESPRAREVLASLPRDYVAVKPYFSRCFPDTAENRAFLSRLLARLTASNEVVLLATGVELDHHTDFRSDMGRVTDLSPLLEARNNLEIQSAVIRGARALYTTYGGFGHLAPFLGVRALCFYSDDAFNPVHRDVMVRAVRSLRQRSAAGFVLANVADFPLLDRVAGPTMEVAGT